MWRYARLKVVDTQHLSPIPKLTIFSILGLLTGTNFELRASNFQTSKLRDSL